MGFTGVNRSGMPIVTNLLICSRCVSRCVSTAPRKTNSQVGSNVRIQNDIYQTDDITNVTPSVLNQIGRNLHNHKHHPLNLIKLRIQSFFNTFVNKRGNPLFSFHDNISPVVTLQQNFDSLLIPDDHPSRKLSDSYYINSGNMLRAHTSAHQNDLIRSGLDSFLICGDVYRRDEIDSSHYPVFHQIEGVRLFTKTELFGSVNNPAYLTLHEKGCKTEHKQEHHTLVASRLIEHDLKNVLQNLALHLFGKGCDDADWIGYFIESESGATCFYDINMQWVETYFPFTHPSWELEIKYQEKWMEVLGCGIMEQEILNNCGVEHKVGWAFGLGLERLAMKLYDIPDIRLFWSADTGFLSQFVVDDPHTNIKYKTVSKFPQCSNDISFWIPSNYSPNDFFDLVRSIGGDIVEQVNLVDNFQHPKTKRQSHCYRITYRHISKTLSNEEVNLIHKDIEKQAALLLDVEIR